ncbi:hypothetical protein I7I53_09456 [Histoplasma capsulatum var. duboisii H88]|uniref:Uncharacterized protein n=1 Tax=Ajellomyces capsulatus (strain H88) TaxID=544711 RepID=A0A8A1LAU0_AJEC8|nr:hypothetical protein I7I53_09456 [Histoplasma capsulatum var. duboisii H88]
MFLLVCFPLLPCTLFLFAFALVCWVYCKIESFPFISISLFFLYRLFILLYLQVRSICSISPCCFVLSIFWGNPVMLTLVVQSSNSSYSLLPLYVHVQCIHKRLDGAGERKSKKHHFICHITSAKR